MSFFRWLETDKGDPRCRALADRHYTRQHVGHPMWTRPGYSQVLFCEQRSGRSAVFVWWRPCFELGVPFAMRKDGLFAIECTIFRNETRFRSSDMIVDALRCLGSWKHYRDVALRDGIITAVSSEKTATGRSALSPAGHCFRAAGFSPFEHRTSKRADLWLRFLGEMPEARVPEKTERLRPRRSYLLFGA